jgi:hypothetical protein
MGHLLTGQEETYFLEHIKKGKLRVIYADFEKSEDFKKLTKDLQHAMEMRGDQDKVKIVKLKED